MREAEAKTKWCPFARVSAPWRWAVAEHQPMPVAAVNRGSEETTKDTRCIASACMAWRFDLAANRPIVAASQPDDMTIHERLHGFCGLAGAPR